MISLHSDPMTSVVCTIMRRKQSAIGSANYHGSLRSLSKPLFLYKVGDRILVLVSVVNAWSSLSYSNRYSDSSTVPGTPDSYRGPNLENPKGEISLS